MENEKQTLKHIQTQEWIQKSYENNMRALVRYKLLKETVSKDFQHDKGIDLDFYRDSIKGNLRVANSLNIKLCNEFIKEEKEEIRKYFEILNIDDE